MIEEIIELQLTKRQKNQLKKMEREYQKCYHDYHSDLIGIELVTWGHDYLKILSLDMITSIIHGNDVFSCTANAYKDGEIHIKNIIIPYQKNELYDIQCIYFFFLLNHPYIKVVLDQKKKKKYKNILSMDVGVDNLGACASSFGDTFLMDGTKLKAWNYYYLKRVNNYMGICKESKHISKLKEKNYRYILSYCKKASDYLQRYCLLNQIDLFLIGKIPIKKKLSFEKFMSMEFKRDNVTSFSMSLFIYNVKEMCWKNGIECESVPEDYSSKCSFYDGESVKLHDTYMGKRTTRGLFRTGHYYYVNADVNAAFNFYRVYIKQNQRIQSAMNWNDCKQSLRLHPVRIKIMD